MKSTSYRSRSGICNWYCLWPSRVAIDDGEEMRVAVAVGEGAYEIQTDVIESSIWSNEMPGQKLIVFGHFSLLTCCARFAPRGDVATHVRPHILLVDESGCDFDSRMRG